MEDYQGFYWLIRTKPKGERMWADVAIVLSLILLGMLLDIGLAFKDLPLGRALRDLFNWQARKKSADAHFLPRSQKEP
jgi:hypothetical protein